ncbi:MAG: stage III sporulation protein AC [Clostridia bacterium]|nr:stage III sporulation protein AC [Clostridia bacterium]
MDITLIIKVAGVGLLVSAAYQVLSRSGRDEQAMLVSLAGVIIVLFMLIGEISRLFDSVRQTFGF